MTFSFGQSQYERIEVEVLRHERQPVGEYHDDNWLTVQVRVCVGGFRGTVDGAFVTEEFVAFLPSFVRFTRVCPARRSSQGWRDSCTCD
jgi:hypothetical protein